MLHADPFAVEGVASVRDVTGGEHAGHAGLKVLVDEDAVVDCDARPDGEPGARLDPDTDHDEVALELAAVARADSLDRPVAFEGLDAGAHQHLRAVVGMDVAVEGTHFGPHHPLERNGERIEDRDLEAALTGGGGDLGTDPARPDDHHRAAALESSAQGVRVPDAAQVQHAVQLGPRNREASRLGPGGEQQPVVAQPLAVVEPELAA